MILELLQFEVSIPLRSSLADTFKRFCNLKILRLVLDTVIQQKEKLSEVLKQNNPLQIKEEADKLGNLTADFANYVMEVSIKNHSKNI